MKKAIITVIGKDRVGIIAAISTKLAQHGVNIMDITQTVLQDYFSMIMLVDLSGASVPFEDLQSQLHDVGKSINMSIRIQHEDIFDAMHRV